MTQKGGGGARHTVTGLTSCSWSMRTPPGRSVRAISERKSKEGFSRKEAEQKRQWMREK